MQITKKNGQLSVKLLQKERKQLEESREHCELLANNKIPHAAEAFAGLSKLLAGLDGTEEESESNDDADDSSEGS